MSVPPPPHPAASQRATLGLAPWMPGIFLIIIVFWALAAVMMLTGTLINAREIDDDVKVINNQVLPIDRELDNVKLAGETAKISARILTAAKPLSGQLTQVNEAAKSINGRARDILDTAGSINRTAKTINSTARSINATVASINGTVVSINSQVVSIGGTVGSIGRSVASIHGTVRSINRNVTTIRSTVRSIFQKVGPVNAGGGNSINASVARIEGTLATLTPVTRSIDSGVAAINGRADRGIGGAAGLHSDLSAVSAQVGLGIVNGAPDHGSPTRSQIHGHANSIDCAPLVNLAGPTQYCGQ